VPPAKPTDNALGRLLHETEALMTEVKNEYEMYFLQQLRQAPDPKVRLLRQKVRELDRHFSSNTALKFKRTALRARFGSLDNYWRRINLQIENGTYHRHQVVADRHNKQRQDTSTQAELLAARAAEREKSGPSTRTFRGDSGQAAEYYMQAREQLGESVKGLDARKVSLKLTQHAKAIKARTGCADVAFSVKVEDGKTKLMAVPVKK
jgi:hypothetical protein